MLYYLAVKTGAEFNTYIGRSLRLTPKLKGKTGEYKISYVEEDDRITISWLDKLNLVKTTYTQQGTWQRCPLTQGY